MCNGFRDVAKYRGTEGQAKNFKAPWIRNTVETKARNPEEAAREALNAARLLTRLLETEIGGIIYFNPRTGRYSYTVEVGTESGVLISYNHPAGTALVADYHSHGMPVPGKYYETFSTQDRDTNKEQKIPGYLLPPHGNATMFDPATGNTTTLEPPIRL